MNNNYTIPAVVLKPKREKSVRNRHPWIFSGAVQRIEGTPVVGETCNVFTHHGEWLCRGAFSPHSNIRVRIWTWDPDQQVDQAFFDQLISTANQLRNEQHIQNTSEMYRLVNAESDGLPGLIVDRYGEVLVVQFLSAGADTHRENVIRSLARLPDVKCIYERSDVDVRVLEGLASRTGTLWGSLPDQPMTLSENGLRFQVDLVTGQKTGFYLDQRENREIFKKLVADKQVLNCFSYTGAFSVFALAGCAQSIISVESSNEALSLARKNLALNGFDPEEQEWIEGDVFQVLRLFRDQGRTFDVIVLDPPKFAPTSTQAERAARGYKDINLLAFKLLRPGGLLFTFSCSGGVSMDLFQKIVASAARDAGVQPAIIRHLFQGPDHPVRLNFPEGSYLKGLVCQIAY